MDQPSRILLTLSLSLAAAGCGGSPSEGPEGPEGPSGPQGAPGELRVYGDGSAGSLVVDQPYTLLTEVVDDGNTQFTDVTIAAGGELIVPSGMVLRATGTITVAGTLTVEQGAGGGSFSFLSPTELLPRLKFPEPGIAGTVPGTPTVVAGAGTAYEGGGSSGLYDEARYLFRPGRVGGGGGWYGPRGGALIGVEGGGALIVVASTIAIDGSIVAQGGGIQAASCSGCSGGGGGFVLVAARDSLTTGPAAVIDVRGGSGGDAYNAPVSGVSPAVAIGPGGGGGGGCVHLIAPSIVHEGDAVIDGGEAGFNATLAAPPELKIGGTGGGSSCGAGGGGGRLFSGGTTDEANPGAEGRYFRTEADPTALL